jgi:HlyD family secretion protein
MLNFLKKPSTIIILIVIIAAAAGGYFYFTKKPASTYEYTTVGRGNVIQEVSVTGNVKPAETVDLAFEKTAKITKASVKVGDKVKAGQVLATLESRDITAQLIQAQAGVQAQQANLDELKKGTRPEELQVAQAAVSNAQKALTDAQNSLATAKNSADANLQSAYNSGLNSAAKSANVALNSLFTLTDIQYDHFAGYDQNSANLESAKGSAVFALLGATGAGRATNDALNQLDGGAKASVQTAQANPTPDNINKALGDIANALQKVQDALSAVPITSALSSTDTLNLSTEKSNINAEIITIAGKQQAIDVQKAANKTSIASADSAVTTAQNTLASAQANLTLKQAGSTPEQIAAQEAQVRQAVGNLQNIQSQLAKTVITAPVDGTITQQDAKVGEMATPNKIIISIISTAKFEIEANVPEADIAKVKVGDTANITLDAYGNDVIFPATVISIDPAETIVEGVATYKTKFQFVNEDGRIKPGMTANIDIMTDKRDNALAIPQRAVITKGTDKFVLLDTGKPQPEEVKVETGLKGSDGNIEIVSGLKEGDKIVSFGGTSQ